VAESKIEFRFAEGRVSLSPGGYTWAGWRAVPAAEFEKNFSVLLFWASYNAAVAAVRVTLKREFGATTIAEKRMTVK